MEPSADETARAAEEAELSMLRAAAEALAVMAAEGFASMLARGVSLGASLKRPAAEHGRRMAEAAHRDARRSMTAHAVESASKLGTDAGRAAKAASGPVRTISGELLRSMADSASNMADSARRAYLREASRAAAEARSGAKTQPDAVRDAVSRLAERGIDCASHVRRDGVRVNVPADVGVRRIVEGRCASEMNDRTIALVRESGQNLVDVPAHRGSRPSHARWQGMTYRLEGADAERPNFFEACRVGDPVNGLGGYGCRHTVEIHTDDFEPSPPASDEQVEREYRVTQQQRRLERDMRKLRRAKQVLEECGLDSHTENVRIRAKQAQLRALVRENGDLVKRERHRERAYSRARAGNLTPYEVRRVGEETAIAAAKAEELRRLDENMRRAKRALRERVDAGNIGILEGKQNKHVVGSKEFRQHVETCMKKGYPSPSYLTISTEEADELVRKHSGTGEPALDGNGLWNGREKCTSPGIIGVVVTKGGKHIPTNGFTIHYSKKGTHIVPRR